MRRRPAPRLWRAVVVLWALACVGAAEPPLTNEEIVRRVAAGEAEESLLEAIKSRPPAFALDDEMLEELALAGVPASVVAAMKAREAEVSPAPPPPERLRPGRVRVIVELDRRTLRVPDYANEDLKDRLNLSREVAARRVDDLAVFLACGSAVHIPDQWRSKTPLGRDLSGVARHEMLAFVAGDTPSGSAPRIKLPERIEAEVDDLEPHDLILGVAARIGDRWVELASARLEKRKVAEGDAPLAARIKPAGAPFAFEVAWRVPVKS